MKFYFFIFLCVSASLRLSAQQLPPMPPLPVSKPVPRVALLAPRQQALITRHASLTTTLNTNRVSVVSASKLIGGTNYVWNSSLWETNALKIVTLPGTAYLAAPETLGLRIEWDVPMNLLVAENVQDAELPEPVTVHCIVPVPNDSAHKFFRVQVDSYGNAPQSQAAVLRWNPSPSVQVVGYDVYYGPASAAYTNVLYLGAQLKRVITGLDAGADYYFAVAARDFDGVESDLSNEVSYTAPPLINSDPQIQNGGNP